MVVVVVVALAAVVVVSLSAFARPFLSLVIFHARLDGAFIVSSERAPPSEMFSRSSLALSGRLSTNNPESRGPKLGIRLARQEVIWRVAREHLGRTESFRLPRPAPRVRVPRGTSRNYDKEVANHRRDGRTRRFRRFASPAELVR